MFADNFLLKTSFLEGSFCFCFVFLTVAIAFYLYFLGYVISALFLVVFFAPCLFLLSLF